MLATELYAKVAPFAMLCSKHALSPNYRALMLSNDKVRGCASFGAMEVDVNLGLEREIYVNAEAFLQVTRSLSNKDLELSVRENVLAWKCGAARGQLAILSEKISIDETTFVVEPVFELPAGFSRSLDLGSIAAGTTALLSVGLYGVLLDNGSILKAYASDDTTISICKLSDPVDDTALAVTLSPDAAKLLATITRKPAMLSFSATAVFCKTGDTRLVLKQVPALKHDIKSIAAGFSKSEISLPLDREIITNFNRRADALAEEGKAIVTIRVEDGMTKLAFVDGVSSTEEFYLVDAASDISVDPIHIEARRMSKALAQATNIVFDYAEQNVLVLRGENEFAFVISGKRPTA